MRYLTALLLMSLPFMTVGQQNQPQHYKIYSTSQQKLVSVDDVLAGLDKADILFFGEEHNDSTCHVLEYLLFKGIDQKYPGKTALSMEMFETDCQEVLNEYLDSLIREKNFITEARAWHNYKDYRSLIEYAKVGKIPVVAANAPARYVNMVNRMGLSGLEKLDKTARSWLAPMPIDTATGTYYNKFLNVMGGHSAMGGMQMFQAQNVWDATMGWSIASFYKKHREYKVLQVNGGFHSEDKLGAAAQMKKYAPKARIINIACFSDEKDFDNPDWSKYSKDNDYIILTDPKVPKTF
jgi:uncharacterized iron-regulated protein